MRRLAVLLPLCALLAPASAVADNGSATIKALPESQEVQASVEVQHQCPEYLSNPASSCDWFAEAAQYPASTECPITFDGSHGVWVGRLETVPVTSYGTFAFRPRQSSGAIRVCLYVYAEGSSLVGQSHPFNLDTGREILPPPPEAPPTPEPSLNGLRQCERPNLAGGFLAASPSISCRAARTVRARVFGRLWFSTRASPCENRTYCVVLGFRCYGRYAGHLRPFSYAHHASCRSGRRRIVIDTG